ncbi:Regulator of RNase E activity RraA [Rhodospirillales bacterium URHD0017]|nr:Regulator of RNase E activity RraA [Rhodospirillales bacterium URHD0017]
MALAQATRDKLVSVGTGRVTAALAKHGLGRQSLAGLRPLSPFQDPLVGPAATAIDACTPGAVLAIESSVTSAPLALLTRRKVAGVVSNSPLRNAAEIARAGLPAWQRPSGTPTKPLPVEAGDILFGDRAGLIVIPAGLADQIAEETVEAMAYEEFVAEQVSAGGGVYGLHIPSGEHARRAFAAWRRMKGR